MTRLTNIVLPLLLAFVAALAGEMPFPQVENGKLFLQEKDSPYILEQGVVLSSTDTFAVEPGVTVLMGEYAKLMLRGPGYRGQAYRVQERGLQRKLERPAYHFGQWLL